MKVEFTYLSEEDLIKVGVLDIEKCVSVMEDMFSLLGKQDYLLGGPGENHHGIRIWFPKEKRTDNMPVAGPDRRFMSLVGYLGGEFNICGEKWYGSNQKNREKGMPRSILTITLNDIDTGQPLAYMSGNLISATRTGAIPGVAAKYLAVTQVETLAIIGAGVISWSSTMAILSSRKEIKKVKVFDIAKERAEDFCTRIEKEYGIIATATNSLEETLEDSDLVNLAASGENPPEINSEYIKDGATIMVSGSAKLPDEFLIENKIVTDNWNMHKSTAKDWVEWENLQSGVEEIRDDLYYGIAGQVFKLVERKKLNEDSIVNLA